VTTRILVIDDDPAVRRLMQEELEFEGFTPSFAESGAEGVEAFARDRPDLVLLDLILPDMSGFEVCRKLRDVNPEVPVIVVSARKEDTDKVRGLDIGADDYVTKPFSLAVLAARIRAVLRRHGAAKRAKSHVVGALRLDVRSREAYLGDVLLQLTHKEFELLKYLLEHRGEAVSRDQILDSVWPGVFVTHRTVDTHMASLRKKLGQGPARAPEIESLRGVGYKLKDEPPGEPAA
jgi:two-component system, OmpR family, alkaline phosphatase synthesis response regulator PhoP